MNVRTNYCPLLVKKGAQWLSGRVLDSRHRGLGFKSHRRHCVVSLSKNINPSLVLFQPRKTLPFITERLLMGGKESNQTNQILEKNVCNSYMTWCRSLVDSLISLTQTIRTKFKWFPELNHTNIYSLYNASYLRKVKLVGSAV